MTAQPQFTVQAEINLDKSEKSNLRSEVVTAQPQLMVQAKNAKATVSSMFLVKISNQCEILKAQNGKSIPVSQPCMGSSCLSLQMRMAHHVGVPELLHLDRDDFYDMMWAACGMAFHQLEARCINQVLEL